MKETIDLNETLQTCPDEPLLSTRLNVGEKILKWIMLVVFVASFITVATCLRFDLLMGSTCLWALLVCLAVPATVALFYGAVFAVVFGTIDLARVLRARHMGRQILLTLTALSFLSGFGIWAYMSTPLFATVLDKTAFGVYVVIEILSGLAVIAWIAALLKGRG